MTTSNQCPECGYPDTKDGQHFKGIYTSEVPCPRCQFFQGCVPVEVLTKADVQNEGSVVTATRAPYPTAWANYDMKDIELHVRVRMHNDCVMGYEVRVLKLHDDGIGDPHKFEMSGESGALECTPDIEKADRLIEGTIK